MTAPLALLAVLAVEAGAAGLSPSETALLASQIQSESSWRHDVCSPAGACGLTQFMPATWADVAGRIPGCADADRADPVCAVRAQIAYMRRLGRFVDRSVEPATSRAGVAMTLSAYNGGAGWLLRESRACGGSSGCDGARWRLHVQTVCLRRESACRENKRYPGRIMVRVFRGLVGAPRPRGGVRGLGGGPRPRSGSAASEGVRGLGGGVSSARGR